MKKTMYVLLVLLVWLQYALWFGKNGICDLISMYKELNLHRDNDRIIQMKIRNKRLSSEVHDLIYGYSSIEERSRCDFGMIQTGEVFYQLKV